MTWFRFVCLAQLISRMGSELSGFALGVWFYRRTGLISASSLFIAATAVPQLALAPLAGVLIDRSGRRPVLVAGHLAAGALGLGMFALFSTGRADIVAATLLIAAASALRAGEVPALSALTTELTRPEERNRANGLSSLTYAVPQLAAPVLAGWWLDRIGVHALLALDAATFVIAAIILAALPLPRASAAQPAPMSRRRGVGQLLAGWDHIRARPLLLWLTAFLALMKWNGGMLLVLITPFALGFADARRLGAIRSGAGLGMMLGAACVALGLAPARHLYAVLCGAALQGVLLILLGLRPSVPIAMVTTFLMLFCTPVMVSANESIWQGQVPLALQGRVLSFRGFIAGAALPLALVAAGPLADVVFARLGGAGPLLATLGGSTLLVAGIALLHPAARATFALGAGGNPAEKEPARCRGQACTCSCCCRT